MTEIKNSIKGSPTLTCTGDSPSFSQQDYKGLIALLEEALEWRKQNYATKFPDIDQTQMIEELKKYEVDLEAFPKQISSLVVHQKTETIQVQKNLIQSYSPKVPLQQIYHLKQILF